MLGIETFTLRRYDPETIGSDGRASRTYTDSSIDGVLQPLRGSELMSLPEGDRRRSPRKFYTETAVRTVDDETGTPADSIIADGETFQVQTVERQRKGLAHYKATLLKVKAAL